MIEIQELYKKYLECGVVCTDTRQIVKGSIFFALKGPTFNANTFAREALDKGAAYAVVDESAFADNEKCLLVNDGLQALQQLASHHRSQLKIPVIGLTGSNGKTTSKELLNAVLRKKYKTFATKGNLNNHIGVPLSILAIDTSIEIAVIEMGANHVGEIADLSKIANPTHGFITNIGKAHTGMFGGFENVIRAKSELYQHLISNRGQVFINSQNLILKNMAKRFDSPLFYPAAGDYYHAQLISADPFVRFKAENGDEVQTQIVGSYNFENIASALCIGKFFKVDAKLANEAIANYKPENMRSQVVTKGTNIIILDAYNANPSSMAAAIENLASMKASKKVVVLGDMYELENPEAEHQAIGKLIAEKRIDEVFLVGKFFKAALSEIPQARYFESKQLLIEDLKSHPVSHSTILVKASRGIGLEGVLDFL
ncbi:UDP-N-acetylmuramoyl-tripeptide--D-alanyl-D-alanine ligase [Cytophagales bacterium WSM2-2]|nr:UDP-N-acetylmuramoyl-tripeptide--D-alanyl-D-alanine ligase [Cytophagales bacterium WSM2-2]